VTHPQGIGRSLLPPLFPPSVEGRPSVSRGTDEYKTYLESPQQGHGEGLRADGIRVHAKRSRRQVAQVER
jgi:hypothetical protein